MEAVQHLVSMGFSREQAQQALQVADNDIEKAVSYLFDGSIEISNKQDIPTEVFGPPPQHQQSLSRDTSTPTDGSGALNSEPVDLIDLGERPVSDIHMRSSSSSMESLNNSNNDGVDGLKDVGGDDSDANDVFQEKGGPSKGTSPEIALPEVVPRGDKPMVVLNKSKGRYENWLVPILLVMSQVDEFHKKFAAAKGTPLLETGLKLLNDIQDPDRNYVLNDFSVEDNVDTIEELIPRLYELLDSDYSKVYDDHFIEKAFKSTVSSKEEESTQDMFIIEIDFDNRYKNVHDTLNELFWGKDLEGLGNICFDKIGDLFTLYYIGDEDDAYVQHGSLLYPRDNQYNYSMIELRDVIYPGIYSKDRMDKLMQIKQEYDDLNEQGRALNKELISLKIFQGRKIDPIFSQALDFLKNEEACRQLQKIYGNLESQKEAKHQELQTLIQLIEDHDVRKIDNLELKDECGYKLMLVTVSEMEYYYFDKTAAKWAHNVQKITPTATAFDCSYISFDEVNDHIRRFSTTCAKPIGLIYCNLNKLGQIWNESLSENAQSSA